MALGARSHRWIQRSCLGLMLLALVFSAYTLPRLQFNNDILALFPGQDDHSAQALANQKRAASVEREVLLLVSADNNTELRRLLPAMARELTQCDCFAKVAASAAELEREGAFSLAGAHPALLLNHKWRQRFNQQAEYDNPAGAANSPIAQAALRRLLTQPGGFSARDLSQDPLGSLADFQANWQPSSDSISLDSAGFFVVDINGRDYFLLRLTLAASPFSLGVQQAATKALDNALMPVQALAGADVLRTGALFYTHAGTEQAQREISTVGLGSALGIVLLFLLVFRRAGLLVLAFVPIVFGVAVGLSVVQWLFGQVHVIALVFGSVLVGVAIDYTLHFYAKRFDAMAHWQLDAGYRRLLAPLSLGLVTSVAGYLSFTATGFPGFTQVAVMSSAGLVMAFVTVMGLFPLLLARPSRYPPGKTLMALIEAVRHVLMVLPTYLRRPLPALALVFAAVALWPLWQSNDDIRQMQNPPAELKRMEQVFRDALGARQALQYLLVQAPNIDTLLNRLQQVDTALNQQVSAGALADYDILNRWLPGPNEQRQNQELWQRQVIDSGLLAGLYSKLGVSERAQNAMLAKLAQAPIIPAQQLLDENANILGKPLIFNLQGRVYTVVNLYPPFTTDALADIAGQWPYVQWVDPVGRTNQLLQHYRVNASGLLLLAYALIWLVLLVRYGAAGALAVVAPPAIASVLTLFTLLAAGAAISVFHIMALMLVLGIGIDYTLFVRESGGVVRSTLLAIGLSTITTVLSFGLLALSSTQAIAQFGLAVFVGIVLAFLLAPLAQQQ